MVMIHENGWTFKETEEEKEEESVEKGTQVH